MMQQLYHGLQGLGWLVIAFVIVIAAITIEQGKRNRSLDRAFEDDTHSDGVNERNEGDGKT